MDGQTDVGHINLIGGLVTRNPPNKTKIPAIVNEKISDLVHDFMNFIALKII